MLKTAKCTCCNTVQFVDQMVKTSMPNRGGANAYMCQRCATQNQFYHANNNKNRGTNKANNVMIGHEYEVSYNDDYARNIMFEYGLIPTHDCSLIGRRTCEFVTGIQSGLNIASKMVVTIENLINENHLEINDSCGTHFHVSINAMKNENGEQVYMNYIKRFYHSLFIPLCETMQANPEATKNLFGRDFSDWARPVNQYTNAEIRYNFINVTNNSNIEFRLNKFQSAKQMQNLMKMEVEMVQTIVTNFCEHFNDEKIDSRRYANITEYRKHKANITAKKLVKIYEKYASKI